MTQPSKLLSQILVKIRELKALNQASLIVFDLDSTLFDVSPRLQRIMVDFAKNPQNQKAFPESCEILRTVQTLRTDWGIQKALIRAGLDGHHPDFHHALKEHWHRCFFSNEYLQYDIPYDGAQEFVQRAHQTGAHITYLTGRDIARMGTGTSEILKKWDFPLEMERVELVLKPEKSLDDAKFKSDYFAALPEHYFKSIWFFENEPMNTNLVQSCHDHVEIVFFESTHAGVEEPHPLLPKIMHYLIEEED